ncbi:sulfatase [Halorhabdus sp. CUG00001]|uniref:sulfatase n=1 Tax=Halorhabdus sp. CUG00001 TaxID=2600297 RepID=UPI00131DBF26|nr:sulfatase [Halorhabdus sp. CUG00001]
MTDCPRNVLLITIDSLRYDTVDPLERLSLSDPLRFEKAFATGPGTSPSFPGILTGTLPLSHGGLGPLTEGRPMLAEHLQDAGFATGGFQCNPFLSKHFNYDRGFDIFEDYQHPLMGVATKLFPRGIELDGRLGAIDDILHLTDAIKWTYQLVAGKPRPYVSAEVVTDDAVEWLAGASEPFFCWAHYMDVHHPCFPPREYRADHGVADIEQADVAESYSALVSDPGALTTAQLADLEALYHAAIDYTVDQTDRLIERLRDDGRLDETLVVVTSDHGELFGDHGQYGKPERLYDELLRVPLWVTNGPDHLEDATDDLVSLLDVPPMIHDALEIDIPSAYEGRRPGVGDPREYVLAEHAVEDEVIVGARSAAWLYEADEIRDEHRLFDLREGFEHVAADAEGEGPARVRRIVRNRLDVLDVEATQLAEEVEGDVESRLEDLGYL